ncbi:hypothetical protein EDB86DRAFT_2912797 [Lactarius hatsudake]|nr:hypothetical protein EDB86DRAFT_2912797 [Lactarius hatsudake]
MAYPWAYLLLSLLAPSCSRQFLGTHDSSLRIVQNEHSISCDRRIVQYLPNLSPSGIARPVRCGYVLMGPLLVIGMRSMVMNALFWKPPCGYRQDEIRILSFPAADRLSANEPQLSST